MKTEKTCKYCRFYDPSIPRPDDDMPEKYGGCGGCRYYPPRITNGTVGFPITRGNMWCGKWKRLKP